MRSHRESDAECNHVCIYRAWVGERLKEGGAKIEKESKNQEYSRFSGEMF